MLSRTPSPCTTSEDTHGPHQTSSDSVDVGTQIPPPRPREAGGGGAAAARQAPRRARGAARTRRSARARRPRAEPPQSLRGGGAPRTGARTPATDARGHQERSKRRVERAGETRASYAGAGEDDESGARELPLRRPRRRRRRSAGDPAQAARVAGGGRRGGATPWRSGAPRCGPKRRAPAWSASPWAMAMALLSLGVRWAGGFSKLREGSRLVSLASVMDLGLGRGRRRAVGLGLCPGGADLYRRRPLGLDFEFSPNLRSYLGSPIFR